MSFLFSVNCQNDCGNPQYIEKPEGNVSCDSLLPDDVWAVIQPSLALSQWLKSQQLGCLRTYNGKEYWLSPKGSKLVKPEGPTNGSSVAISFINSNTKYFIMLTDSKPYIQNPQGLLEGEENLVQCAMRKVKDELGLLVTAEELKLVGSWTFSHTNRLVDYTYEGSTSAYYVDLGKAPETVAHLFPQGLDCSMVVTGAWLLPCKLEETKHVLAISEDSLDTLSTKIPLVGPDGKTKVYSFDGHQREFPRLLAGKEPKYQAPYLNSFSINP